MFVRRSRKGKIHVVRERIADNYVGLSRGLAKANKNVIDGVWSIHKGLQLGLAKGHNSVQSGLKTIQDFTGDFNMYQYEPPVAVFSMAEVDKYNRYQNSAYVLNDGYANFAVSAGKVKRTRPAAPVKVTSQLGKDYRRATRTFRELPVTAPQVASKGYGMARGAVSGGYGLAKGGIKGGYGLAKGGAGMIGGAAAGGLGYLSEGAGKLGALAGSRPALAGALLAGTAVAGVGGTMFMRRRRTKKGKIVVEQVRR